jgi:hypothetical protein
MSQALLGLSRPTSSIADDADIEFDDASDDRQREASRRGTNVLIHGVLFSLFCVFFSTFKQSLFSFPSHSDFLFFLFLFRL